MAFDLSRFINAQQDVYASALSELRAGCKRGHWMWFVFPQLRGLGHSKMSRLYGLKNIAEATAYLQHPILGHRLIDCTNTVLGLRNIALHHIFGSPDNMKFISSMTLFSLIDDTPDVFGKTLAKFNDGNPDPVTIRLSKEFEEPSP
uniref:Calpastatin n=1 Tax=Candidatus Nitrotoga fabula TaxID=2182327 RepID=A0A2X0QUE0_9PROT|nr:conserved protein of unknown function [Candidatus Nitrotoga fabula]